MTKINKINPFPIMQQTKPGTRKGLISWPEIGMGQYLKKEKKTNLPIGRIASCQCGKAFW